MIPISTDAPLYHKPIATCLLIAVNLVMFLAFYRHQAPARGPYVLVDDQGNQVTLEQLKAADPEGAAELEEILKHQSGKAGRTAMNTLSVEFGKVRPWQWLTTNFMHANFEHLLGNMIFLWAFGLVVEGKVGHAAFLGIYLGIGIFYGMLIQMGSLWFGNQGIALGASGVIFGLLALCVIWAPANEFTVFTGRWLVDVPILLFGGFFIGKELIVLYLREFRMSSELLHATGFFIGFPLGAMMVKNHWVDCEGWDLFSYTGLGQSTKGKKKKKRKTGSATTKSKSASSYEDQPYFRELKAESGRVSNTTRKLNQISKLIESRQFDDAIAAFEAAEEQNGGLDWRQPDLYRLIQGLLTEKSYKKALPYVEYHVNNFEENKQELQLILGRLYLAKNDMDKLKRLLDSMNEAELNEKQLDILRKIRQKAVMT
jgi:membrane associated rhomboid family serine protease